MVKQKYWNGTEWEAVGTDASKVEIIDAENRFISDNVEGALQEVASSVADLTNYQAPVIVGTQIQIVQQGTGSRLYFKLDADLTGGAITISKDSGATSKSLVDIDGVAVTELNKGFVEVVENVVNFTYAPKGASLKLIENVLTESDLYGSNILTIIHDADYVYCGGQTTQKVWKLNKSDMTKVSESADYGGHIRVLVQDDTYIYCAGLSGTIWKMRKSDMAKVAESISYGDIYALTQDDTYIYCGGSTGTAANNKIWKINKSDMSKVSESVTYNALITALVQDNDYVYCGGQTTQKVWKLNKSDMSKVSESVTYNALITALVQDNDYVYCAGQTTQKVWKLNKSDMTKVSESSDYGGHILALTQDDNYIYCGGSNSPMTVWKIRKSDMVKAFESAAYGGAIMSLDQDGAYIYIGGQATRKVRKMSNWFTNYYEYKGSVLISMEV